VREEHGLVYSIYSGNSFFDDAGDHRHFRRAWTPANLEKTLKLILREMKRLIDEPVPAAELRRARDYLIGQLGSRLGKQRKPNDVGGGIWLGYGKIFFTGRSQKMLQ
jgi:predicted Zn-dependent peptidase